jgi:hypothetical protein
MRDVRNSEAVATQSFSGVHLPYCYSAKDGFHAFAISLGTSMLRHAFGGHYRWNIQRHAARIEARTTRNNSE